MYEQSYPSKRFRHTIKFINATLKPGTKILDLGVENPFTKILHENGFDVTNSSGEDLDENQEILKTNFDAVVALEIFEHLLNPYTILKSIASNQLVISVPLRLWFSPAYRSKTDMWDRHYHEFEPWQLDWLLEKTGWKIEAREQFTNPVKKVGLRPLLRYFTNRYYIVYAVREKRNH